MNSLRKAFLIAILIIAILIPGVYGIKFTVDKSGDAKVDVTGFDQLGYNYNARIFVGSADGVDKILDGKVWGDPTYSKDHLVMKWSKAWDDARFNGAAWTPDAWEDNEWNGNVPGGSGETYHYKIVWVGPELESSPYWREGGYPVWDAFEIIMAQGNLPDVGHVWDAHGNPTGYGA